ncbi:MAG: hypothetical protein JJU11_04260 [Candidatus Sumerlaeia bacterium]|nr:hypothetical protein [Candidatus Sumerlaeia bacterium]
MKHLTLASMLALFIGAPTSSWACGLCIDSQLNFLVPTYYWVLLLLLVWGICHVAFVEDWLPGMKEIFWRLFSKMLVGIIAVVALFLLAMGSPFLIGVWLLIYFIVIWQRIFLGRIASRRTIWLAVVTGVFLLSLFGIGTAQRLNRDRFDHAIATIFPGTGPVRQFAKEFASDPEFDIDRLRPMIREGTRSDREWAFQILKKRKKQADLDYFADDLSTLPQNYFERDDYSDPGIMYFQMWIRALDMQPPEAEQRIREARNNSSTEDLL